MVPETSTTSPTATLGRSQVPAGWDHPDAGGRDVHAVRRTTVDHLGVAGDDGDSGEGRRLGHVGHHLAQDVDRHALLEHEGGGDGDRARPHHGQVVDRPVHGQMAGGAAGESQGLHDIGVGAEGQAFTRGEIDQGGVGLGRAPALLVLAGEGGQEDGVEQGGRRLATRAVGQGHDLVAQTGPPAPERLDASEDRGLPVARRGVAVAHDRICRGTGHDGRPDAPAVAASGKWRWTDSHRASIRASWTS